MMNNYYCVFSVPFSLCNFWSMDIDVPSFNLLLLWCHHIGRKLAGCWVPYLGLKMQLLVGIVVALLSGEAPQVIIKMMTKMLRKKN